MLTLWFQITINESHEMQVLKGSNHLRGVEPRPLLGQTPPRPRLERTKEFPSHAVLHTKVKIPLGLERVVQSHDERMICGGKNLLLSQRPLDLFAFNHFFL